MLRHCIKRLPCDLIPCMPRRAAFRLYSAGGCPAFSRWRGNSTDDHKTSKNRHSGRPWVFHMPGKRCVLCVPGAEMRKGADGSPALMLHASVILRDQDGGSACGDLDASGMLPQSHIHRQRRTRAQVHKSSKSSCVPSSQGFPGDLHRN